MNIQGEKSLDLSSSEDVDNSVNISTDIKVSVIMAVYNTKYEWLKEAIESILNQTLKELELIIVDDGSTTGIKSVVEQYDDSRIRYFYQENKGVSAARNLAIEKANGKYIAVMDSDDISLPERLERQYNFLENNPKYSVTSSWLKTFPRDEITKNAVKTPKLLDNLTYCYFNNTVMFNKSDFVKFGLKYDENFRIAEDYELWSRACRVLNLYHMPEVLHHYRIAGQGITSTLRDERYVNTIKIQNRLLSYITNNNQEKIKIVDFTYKNLRINKTFTERIFSIKNFYKFNKKYKVFTILGIEFRVLVKEWAIG